MGHTGPQDIPRKNMEKTINAFRWPAAGASLQKIPGRVAQEALEDHLRSQPESKVILWGFTKGRSPNHVVGAIRQLLFVAAEWGKALWLTGQDIYH